MSNLSRQFILNRAQKSCAVAGAIQSAWEWDRQTVAQMNAARVACEVQLDVLTGLEAATRAARGALDSEVDALHAWTSPGVGLARRHFAQVDGKERIFDGMVVESGSREAKMALARRFFKAWAQADTTWSLNLLSGTVDLETYQNKRKAIEGDDNASPPVAGLEDALNAAEQLERREAGKLNKMLEALEAMMEAWYADAVAACPAGSAEGDQVRGQVPTTYDPNHEPLPIPPTPSGLAVQTGPETGSAQAVCLPATFAEEYVWTATLLSDPAQLFQVTTTEPMALLTGMPAASTVAVRVAAQNATGISAASAPVNTETGP